MLQRIKINAEIDPLTLSDGLETTELSPQANPDCDYKKLMEECFKEDVVSEAEYEQCSQDAGCTVGATRRPMYDKMSFRRKQ